MSDLAQAGNSGGTIRSDELVYDPVAGIQETQVWSGLHDAMLGKFNAYTQAGWKCSLVRTEGTPQWKVTAQIGGDGVADVWERIVEWAQIDVRANAALLAGAESARLALTDP